MNQSSDQKPDRTTLMQQAIAISSDPKLNDGEKTAELRKIGLELGIRSAQMLDIIPESARLRALTNEITRIYQAEKKLREDTAVANEEIKGYLTEADAIGRKANAEMRQGLDEIDRQAKAQDQQFREQLSSLRHRGNSERK